MKYLKFYNKCIESGKLPSDGLCSIFNRHRFFKRIDPDNGEMNTYWGFREDDTILSGRDDSALHNDRVCSEFTPLRQNVVLLMAAMNNEL